MVKRVGRPTQWESADLCPNLRYDGTHDPHCQACLTVGGRPYLYTVEATGIKMIWMRDNRDQEFDVSGSWEKGDAIAVFPAHLAITDQDRLVNMDDPVVERLLMQRGATASTADLIRAPHVVGVESVRDASRSYTLNTDFSLTTNTAGQYQILWNANGVQPDAEARYSARLMIRPTWIVMGEPKNRAFGPGKTNQLLKTAECKRFDMAVSVVDGTL